MKLLLLALAAVSFPVLFASTSTAPAAHASIAPSLAVPPPAIHVRKSNITSINSKLDYFPSESPDIVAVESDASGNNESRIVRRPYSVSSAGEFNWGSTTVFDLDVSALQGGENNIEIGVDPEGHDFILTQAYLVLKISEAGGASFKVIGDTHVEEIE